MPLATRTKRHPLSDAQVRTLRALSDGHIKLAGISGSAAKALERRGLVKAIYVREDLAGYQITTTGVEKLKQLKESSWTARTARTTRST